MPISSDKYIITGWIYVNTRVEDLIKNNKTV